MFEIKYISTILLFLLSIVFHSTPSVAADDSSSFLDLGFAQCSSDDEENSDSSSSASSGAEIPLKELPCISCIFSDFRVKAELPQQTSIKAICNELAFSIPYQVFSALKQEALDRGLSPTKHLQANNPEHVGRLIKEVCKAKDVESLMIKVQDKFKSFCLKDQTCETKELQAACIAIYDKCLAKPQKSVAYFKTHAGEFEAFFDENKDNLVIRSLKELAHGAFKQVFHARAIPLTNRGITTLRGTYVSIKSSEEFDGENNKMAKCENEYIMPASIKILSKSIEDSKRNYRFEYLSPCAEGELGKIIFSSLPSKKPYLTITYSLHAAKGLQYLHQIMGWVHRDIKHQNILIIDGIAKISDFGSCLDKENNSQPYVNGAMNGVSVPSPEASIRKDDGTVENGFPMDMWAFGVCLYELLSPKHIKPYFCTDGKGASLINKDNHEELLFSGWITDDAAMKAYQMLIRGLLKFNKNERLTAAQAVLFLEKNHDLSRWK